MKIIARVTGQADKNCMVETPFGWIHQQELIEKMKGVKVTIDITGECIGHITGAYTKDGYVVAEMDLKGTIPWQESPSP